MLGHDLKPYQFSHKNAVNYLDADQKVNIKQTKVYKKPEHHQFNKD